MTLGLEGSIASAPMDNTEKLSVTLAQEAPPSLDLNTPPVVATAYFSVGSSVAPLPTRRLRNHSRASAEVPSRSSSSSCSKLGGASTERTAIRLCEQPIATRALMSRAVQTQARIAPRC